MDNKYEKPFCIYDRSPRKSTSSVFHSVPDLLHSLGQVTEGVKSWVRQRC